VSRKERNISKAQVEKACNVLLGSTSASILVLEDLTKIKTKTSKTKEGYRRKRHNNMLSQVPFYIFKERLTHKAARLGKVVQTVSPAFTSQVDSRSGKRDGARKGRCYYCADGVVLDADWNAAVNIARRANRPLSSSDVPLSGRVRSIPQSSGA
jgi:IS605 OrfB family transposase